jgi:hypothetical protein
MEPASMMVCGFEGSRRLDPEKLAEYMHSRNFQTVAGDADGKGAGALAAAMQNGRTSSMRTRRRGR